MHIIVFIIIITNVCRTYVHHEKKDSLFIIFETDYRPTSNYCFEHASWLNVEAEQKGGVGGENMGFLPQDLLETSTKYAL